MEKLLRFKNGQKWPKMAKMARNGTKMAKMAHNTNFAICGNFSILISKY